jgi:hypothetical protein
MEFMDEHERAEAGNLPRDNVIFLSPDRVRMLEDEVWAEMSETYNPDEAVRRFLGWRATHKAIVIQFPESAPDPGPNAA